MSNEQLKSQVEKWLSQSGYPLEMQVAQAFRRGEFAVYQGEHYQDSEAAREIDVVAHEVRSTRSGLLHFIFYVECKSSRDKPWVVFLGGKRGDFAAKEVLASGPANNHGRALARLLASMTGVEMLPLFRDLRMPAYGVVQTLRKSDGADASYAATMQVCKAARQLAVKKHDAAIGVPVIVIDGNLFSAQLIDEEVVLTEHDQYELLIQNPDVGAPTVVVLVTKTTLPDFVERARQTVDGIVRWCGDNADAVDKALARVWYTEAAEAMFKQLGSEKAEKVLEELHRRIESPTAEDLTRALHMELQNRDRQKR